MIKTSARNSKTFVDYEKSVETADYEAGKILGAAGHFRELSDRLVDTTEQLRHATNQTSELENEIASLRYQLQLTGDDLREANETIVEQKRQVKQKVSEVRARDHTILELQHSLEAARAEIAAKDTLIRESGLLSHRTSISGENAKPSIALSTAILPAELLSFLEDVIPGKSITEQLRAFVDQVHMKDLDFRRMENDLQDTRRKLEEVLSTSSKLASEVTNGDTADGFSSPCQTPLSNRTALELRTRIRQLEEDTATMQANNARLEAACKRYREASEKAEASETELKTERRKLMREVRELQSRVEELEKQNSHLQTRVDKLMKTRPAT